MKKKLCFVYVLSLFAVVSSYGNTVQWGVAEWGYDEYLNCNFLGLGTPSGMKNAFGITTIPSSTQAVLKNNMEAYNLGFGVLLLQTNSGTLIDHDLFFDNPGLFFNTYDASYSPMSETDLTIGLYETVFLAFALVGGDVTNPAWYGWVEFGYDPAKGGVYIVNSAVETTVRLGIYAGVPEPSAALLAIVGLAAFGLRRRKVVDTRSIK